MVLGGNVKQRKPRAAHPAGVTSFGRCALCIHKVTRGSVCRDSVRGLEDGTLVGARRCTVQGGGSEKVARWPVSPHSLALCEFGAYSWPEPSGSASGLDLPFHPVTLGSQE